MGMKIEPGIRNEHHDSYTPPSAGDLRQMAAWNATQQDYPQHAGVPQLIAAQAAATQLTSPAFNATGWELWPYLTMGASVHLLDQDSRVSPVLCPSPLAEFKRQRGLICP